MHRIKLFVVGNKLKELKCPQTRLKLRSLLNIKPKQRFACSPDFHGFTGSDTTCHKRGSFRRDLSKAV